MKNKHMTVVVVASGCIVPRCSVCGQDGGIWPQQGLSDVVARLQEFETEHAGCGSTRAKLDFLTRCTCNWKNGLCRGCVNRMAIAENGL